MTYIYYPNAKPSQVSDKDRAHSFHTGFIMSAWMRQPRFSESCEKYAAVFGGMAGILDMAVTAAEHFIQSCAPYEPDKDYDWHIAIENYAEALFDYISSGKRIPQGYYHHMAEGAVGIAMIE